jgi:hypothetical protein
VTVRPERTTASEAIEIIRLRGQVNELTRALLPSGSPLFEDVSLQLPELRGAPELSFMRTASWLYVHYFEAGRVGVKFLSRLSPPDERGDKHTHLVGALRTWSQHNLSPASDRDRAVMSTCHEWFGAVVGTQLPRQADHWKVLLHVLLTDAREYFERVVERVARIEADPARTGICREWQDRLDRDWPAHRFHETIAVVAADMGRLAIDSVAFYNRYGQRLRDGLNLASADSDFAVEVRKIVEQILILQTLPVLPITGRDIMEELGIGPGPKIGELLHLAQSVSENENLDRTQLLARLGASLAPDVVA